MNFFLCTNCQDDNEKDERDYAVDSFWLQNIAFKQRIDSLTFTNLFEVRDTANALYNLALEFSLGDKIKNDFINKMKFINYLLENLGAGSHKIALQRLKDKFGGKKGMSSKNKREADKIIRESLKGSQQTFQQPLMPHMQMQPFAHMAPMAMPFQMGPLGFPQPQYPLFPQQQQQPPYQPRGTNGPCFNFNCQQTGHVARNCPLDQRNFRRGGNQSRNDGNSGRGNSGRKYYGKKKG